MIYFCNFTKIQIQKKNNYLFINQQHNLKKKSTIETILLLKKGVDLKSMNYINLR